jgi:hypothetical protein
MISTTRRAARKAAVLLDRRATMLPAGARAPILDDFVNMLPHCLVIHIVRDQNSKNLDPGPARNG